MRKLELHKTIKYFFRTKKKFKFLFKNTNYKKQKSKI